MFSIHFTFFLLLASIAIVFTSEPKKRDIFLGVKTNVIQIQIDDEFGGIVMMKKEYDRINAICTS